MVGKFVEVTYEPVFLTKTDVKPDIIQEGIVKEDGR